MAHRRRESAYPDQVTISLPPGTRAQIESWCDALEQTQSRLARRIFLVGLESEREALMSAAKRAKIARRKSTGAAS